MRDGLARPLLGELVGEVAAGIRVLPEADGRARDLLLEIAPRLDPKRFLPESSVTEGVVVLMMRPLLVDLLVASGVSAAEARQLLPDV